jgi:hypothetical protein
MYFEGRSYILIVLNRVGCMKKEDAIGTGFWRQIPEAFRSFENTTFSGLFVKQGPRNGRPLVK